MRVLIIEDEQLAAERMQKLLNRLDTSIQVVAIMDSVKSSVKWFGENAPPDLIFMDIQLSDGLSFEIFEQVTIHCPIIFTTAYEEYAIKAFKVNSIDYLLKPIDYEELKISVNKYYGLLGSREKIPHLEKEILDKVKDMLHRKYKSRFGVRIGEHIRSVLVDDILYFYSLEKGTFLMTKDNKHFLIDYTLDNLKEEIDPHQFFRLNRKYLVCFDAIADVIAYSNSRLKIKLKYSDDNNILVSRERVPVFKSWLDS
jgi:DNA-binding LytR/AlgR family response regulator